MSKYLAELCSLLIEDNYGEFYAHIFSTLLSHGRLLALQLALKCHLPLRQIQHGLAVLVQAGLVFHHTTSEGRTSYDANPRNAYNLVRPGRTFELVQKRFGRAASAIVTQLVLLGHAPVGQLKTVIRTADESTTVQDHDIENDRANSTSIVGSLAKDRPDVEIDNALRELCKHGLICRLREAHFRTEADTRQLVEEKVHNSFSSTAKGTKLKEEFAEKVEEAIEKEVNSCINFRKSGSENMISQKRKLDDADNIPNPKRLKLSNGVAPNEGFDHTYFVGDNTNFLTDSLVVRLNYARIAVLFRNSRLVSLVTAIYGKNFSRTYEAILNQLEPDLPDPQEDISLGPEQERPPGTTSEVDEALLAQDLAHQEAYKEHSGSPWRSVNGYVNGTKHQLTPEARSHLEVLCQEPYRFLSRSLEYPDRYVVEYSPLSIHLRNAEIFRIIFARFDKYAVRIIRVLLDKGKLDEKHLQELVLMSAKELRQILAMLQQAGFLELQEVPREAQRQPSRTIYLWFYDPDRVRKMLIENTYKCMARCFQRMKVERDKIRPTIEKSERSDVKGKEENLLARAELEVLKGWRRKEEWLLGEVGRLDELIFVLRDF
ncbi:hypothetical protein EPUS_04442 [Endocarpon pusillum Z07020]|uniref:DNA-directed RNA polymerase III subunit RPC3 n=1 Tax=Endocarpon pusillum (strain Z07020 / HMAS-L-300199) TaxID=1263415 RepID=U1GG54_ENDPU|nr:uncharacterized protein EPUS_04442 [Endocarpon pusillum Z07020]ERF76622.1 hypothetical protein EPUS_04442 [Endocarpon pusillum Z07020]